MDSGGSTPIPAYQQPSKRRKVAESCKPCRLKKTRCDGRRPFCSPCAERGRICEYNDATVPVSTSTFDHFEARLHKLEGQLTQLSNASDASAFRSATTHSAEPRVFALQGTSSTWYPSGLSQDIQLTEGSSFKPNTGGEHTIAEPGYIDHVTTHFIRNIIQIADVEHDGERPSLGLSACRPYAEIDQSAMVIPDRATADDLVDCYQNCHYPVFPFLHMPTFHKTYQRIWEPAGAPDLEDPANKVLFFATLNIIFALGCLSNSRIKPQTKLSTAHIFYSRSRSILPLDTLDTPSLEEVQWLLLTAHYLTFTRYSARCLNVLAVAIRNAQLLGLHLGTETDPADQLQVQMNRRVWHTCLMLESVYSSILGRQSLIRTDYPVALPAAIDDEFLSADGLGYQPPDTPSAIDAFILTTEIFGLIDRVQTIANESSACNLQIFELTGILKLNEEINRLEHSLPPHLVRDSNKTAFADRENIFKLQADIMACRLLQVRMLLLRPVILAAARQVLAPSSLVHEHNVSRAKAALRYEVSQSCLQAAVRAIAILSSNLKSATLVCSPLALFVTLSAATVIIAASLIPELEISLTDNSPCADAVEQAFQVLIAHQWQMEGLLEAKKQLEKFLKVAIEAKQRQESAPNIILAQPPDPTIEWFGDLAFTDPLQFFHWGSFAPV